MRAAFTVLLSRNKERFFRVVRCLDDRHTPQAPRAVDEPTVSVSAYCRTAFGYRPLRSQPVNIEEVQRSAATGARDQFYAGFVHAPKQRTVCLVGLE